MINIITKKELSSTALAKELHVPVNTVFERLNNMGFIVRKNDSWELTRIGIDKGGCYKNHPKYGTYISWPDSIVQQLYYSNSGKESFTATSLGKHFNMSANRVNSILLELGWISKEYKGWVITKQGERLGGIKCRDGKSGIPYVRWPETILDNNTLVRLINEIKGENTKFQEDSQNLYTDDDSFRKKFPAKFRATDGHYVRSKAELLIDNWLYVSGIVHAYERKLPINENVYCDFYLPQGRVYIEFWGLDTDNEYISRKKKKVEIYHYHGFQLIELSDKEVTNLDDIMPALLLDFGLKME